MHVNRESTWFNHQGFIIIISMVGRFYHDAAVWSTESTIRLDIASVDIGADLDL